MTRETVRSREKMRIVKMVRSEEEREREKGLEDEEKEGEKTTKRSGTFKGNFTKADLLVMNVI